MKKILGRIPTASIVLAIIAVMFAIWGAYQNSLYQKSCEIFDSAVQIDDPAALTEAQIKEYDGALVCLKGKLTLKHAPKDPMTGFTLPDALVLVRKTEMYQYSLSGDKVVTGFYDGQQANIVGKNDEFYENPVFPEGLCSMKLLADVSVGNVKLADDFVNTFTNGYPYLSETGGFAAAEPNKAFDNPYGLTLRDGCYVTGDPDAPQLGDLRVRYEYIPLSRYPGSMFFFGKLSGGVLGGGGITKNEFMTDLCDTFAQVREKIPGSRKTDATGLNVLVVLNAAAAVIVFIAVTVKNKKRRDNG